MVESTNILKEDRKCKNALILYFSAVYIFLRKYPGPYKLTQKAEQKCWNLVQGLHCEHILKYTEVICLVRVKV